MADWGGGERWLNCEGLGDGDPLLVTRDSWLVKGGWWSWILVDCCCGYSRPIRPERKRGRGAKGR